MSSATPIRDHLHRFVSCTQTGISALGAAPARMPALLPIATAPQDRLVWLCTFRAGEHVGSPAYEIRGERDWFPSGINAIGLVRRYSGASH